MFLTTGLGLLRETVAEVFRGAQWMGVCALVFFGRLPLLSDQLRGEDKVFETPRSTSFLLDLWSKTSVCMYQLCDLRYVN